MMKFMPGISPVGRALARGGYAGTIDGRRPKGRRLDISIVQMAIAMRVNAKSFHARPPFLDISGRHGLCSTESPMLDRELKRLAVPA